MMFAYRKISEIGQKPPTLKITSSKKIGPDEPCFIIAEAGQNHQGSIEYAKQLISAAKEAGADCIKFQKSCLTEKFTKKTLDQPYINNNSWGKTYGEHKSYLEFNNNDYIALQKYAEECNIIFSASAMDIISLKFLEELDVPFIKIGSGDNTNILLLEEAFKSKKPIIISTGMQDMKQVNHLYKEMMKYHDNFALLHCVSAYPTNLENVNLRILDTYREAFPDINIGYSGHEVGYYAAIAAVAKGAKIIEKHFTLDKNWIGADHSSSLEPHEFKEMVRGIRDVEKCLGKPEKMFEPCEKLCWDKLGKSLVAGQKLIVGEILTKEKIKIKVSQPKGIAPDLLYEVIGSTPKRIISEDEPLNDDDLV